MLISAAPLKRSCCCSKGAVTLRTRPPGCRIDIKENTASWQELSFNQHSLCFAYLPWFKTKLTLMNSRWGSSELHVISVRYSSGKTDLCPHLPLKGLFYLHEELRHSAPGLPDAELILKKLPPVGKPFLLINTPFVLLVYLDLKQNSPWCKTKVREFTTDHRTVRVIRAHNLISPAPSLQESFFFLWK